jgi:hypothetical protein
MFLLLKKARGISVLITVLFPDQKRRVGVPPVAQS